MRFQKSNNVTFMPIQIPANITYAKETGEKDGFQDLEI